MVFSSSEVYGKGVSVPFSEDDDRVMGPTHKLRWSYACGKAVDECLAQAYFQQRSLAVVVVRCFNTCGPRQSAAYGMVIPNMIERALRHTPALTLDQLPDLTVRDARERLTLPHPVGLTTA